MLFLQITNSLDSSHPFIAILFTFLIGFAMIWAPSLAKSHLRTAVRVTGGLLCLPMILLAFLAVIFNRNDPTLRTFYKSSDGSRVAYLYHTELRDSAATRVSVRVGCCTRVLVYEYFGSGSDYVDSPNSRPVEWLDASHIVVRYAVDNSVSQVCHPQAGDVQVICEPHNSPVFPPN